MACNRNNKKENIQVFVRVRPRNSTEKQQNSPSVIEVHNKKDVTITDISGKNSKRYSFDGVFGPNSKQIEVYNSVLHQIIDEVLAGYNCTVFAYGQTGSGKTYTMEGERSPDENISWKDDPNCGIIPRCFNQLFDELRITQMDHTVRVSFLEIYNEELIDLLSLPNDQTKLKLFDDSSKKGSVIVSGLEEKTVETKDEVYKILEKGTAKRQTASTLMNAHSSRSHTIFTITVHTKEVIEEEEFFRIGKLNLVDLAGSENISRSGAVDRRAREAGSINQSLLTLGRVITSLVEHRPHVPYRESKLTRMLQDSLGGRTKTSVIATISPAAINYDETLSTLNYANRAKCIVNKPEVNEKQTQRALLKEYIDELDRLRRDLKACRNKEGIYISEENYNEMVLKLKNNDQEIAEKINGIRAIEAEKQKLEAIIHELQMKAKENEDNLAEEKFVLEHYLKTEDVLLKTAKEVQDVAGRAVNHVSLLHDKIVRKDDLEQHNMDVLKRFYELLAQSLENMSIQYGNFMDHQFGFHTKQKRELDEKMHDAETLFNIVQSSFKNISKSFTEMKTDKLTEFLQKSLIETKLMCDEIVKIIRDDVNMRQITTNTFFESVISHGLNNILANILSLQEWVKENESNLTEDLIVVESLNEINEKIRIDLEHHCDIFTECIAALSKENVDMLELTDKFLKEHLIKKKESLDAIKHNSLILDKENECVSLRLTYLKEEQREIAEKMLSHREDIQTILQQSEELNKERCSITSSMLSDVQSIESMLADTFASFKSDMMEKLLSLGNLFENNLRTPSEVAFSGEMPSTLMEGANDISLGISALCESSKNICQKLTENVECNQRRFSQELTSIIDNLEHKTAQVSEELSKHAESSSNFTDCNILTYTPTGDTPQRKEYRMPKLDDEPICSSTQHTFLCVNEPCSPIVSSSSNPSSFGSESVSFSNIEDATDENVNALHPHPHQLYLTRMQPHRKNNEHTESADQEHSKENNNISALLPSSTTGSSKLRPPKPLHFLKGALQEINN